VSTSKRLLGAVGSPRQVLFVVLPPHLCAANEPADSFAGFPGIRIDARARFEGAKEQDRPPFERKLNLTHFCLHRLARPKCLICICVIIQRSVFDVFHVFRREIKGERREGGSERERERERERQRKRSVKTNLPWAGGRTPPRHTNQRVHVHRHTGSYVEHITNE